MVEEVKDIFKRFPKQQKTDTDVLIKYLRENPDDDTAYLLLRKYQPILFDIDLWNKADLFFEKYKISQKKEEFIEEKNLVLTNDLNLQTQIIDKFLASEIPDFLN